jgi:ABC-type phosphate transport system substrate-binding protein
MIGNGRYLYIILLCILIFSFDVTAVAETAVIVHPENRAHIELKDISRIFLSKTRRFPGGAPVYPINLNSGSIARYEFESNVLKMSRRQLSKYWSETIFSKSIDRPDEIKDQRDIVKLVSENKKSIAYVDYRFVDDSVKVIHTIQHFSGR